MRKGEIGSKPSLGSNSRFGSSPSLGSNSGLGSKSRFTFKPRFGYNRKLSKLKCRKGLNLRGRFEFTQVQEGESEQEIQIHLYVGESDRAGDPNSLKFGRESSSMRFEFVRMWEGAIA